MIVDILIATLNSDRVLEPCLKSIKNQCFPSQNIHIFIVDGGSNDATLTIAKKYHCSVLINPLKTAEAAKAIGVRHTIGDYVALIDSDNILPDPNWFKLMLKPLEDNPDIIGSEPWEYTYRPRGGYIERYSSLTGVNDPYTLVAGNYDRKSILNACWTNLNLPIKNLPDYQIATLQYNHILPTIGANGTIFRRSFFDHFRDKYLFDIDILTQEINRTQKSLLFAKVKIGIIHSFCESSLSKFYRKQLRRATDLYIYQNFRHYTLTKNNLFPTIKFILYVILILPMLYDTLRGILKKPDLAWLFHPLACLITLYCYSIVTLKKYFGLLSPLSRKQWQQ
jgi:glycosyltransferase involved in cell wall biosynthesis